jgi:nucleoid-associated protein YgaU
MSVPKSRYAAARPFTPPADGRAPFPGLRPRPIAAAEGVLEHLVKAGDRLDLLARHYYNNDRLWWRILDANPELFLGQSFAPPAGDAAEAGDPPEHAPGIALCPAMEGAVLLIPRAVGS